MATDGTSRSGHSKYFGLPATDPTQQREDIEFELVRLSEQSRVMTPHTAA